ncbi:HEL331Wp [Eremothecium sinecaudum]|uniref:HEL331Wp n=1 Tax=Eremothecium sinecaudum TaxID=45286 RepID=A0A0X8HT19_9SACH|nr:HEL331Wp [Eremothecium sinecaudum]AMD20950.1 HEL331Wp [Eremothecium sinecaudum]
MLKMGFVHISKRFNSSTAFTKEYLNQLLKRVDAATTRERPNKPKPLTRIKNNRENTPKRYTRAPGSFKRPNLINNVSGNPIEGPVKRKTQRSYNGYSEVVNSKAPRTASTHAKSRLSVSSDNKKKNTASKKIPGISISKIAPKRKSLPDASATTYCPETPTVLSLLKYRANWNGTSHSKLISFGIETLKESNFPLNSEFNNGVDSKTGGNTVNARKLLESEEDGLVLKAEPLTNEITVTPDLEQLSSSVIGSYQELKALQSSDFVKISKSEAKRNELLSNSEVVRLSLGKLNLEPSKKQLMLDVCSGLKPVAELYN